MAIPQTFDEALARVKELVSIFQQNEERYRSPGYSEAQARLDFIDKFWILSPGWISSRLKQSYLRLNREPSLTVGLLPRDS